MAKTVRVNLKTRVNAASIVHEKRDGRDVIRVPSATLPDDVVMNGILYPAAEIAKSFHTLERTPAPLGHPMIGNRFVSAREPEAINGYWIGAHNENVRRENGRVRVDKIIDVDVANRTEKGRALIAAINKGEPIHTSTGIFVDIEDASNAGYKGIARNMLIDHDAILMGEVGAATPKQGVGMMVNAAGTEEQVDFSEIDLDEEAMKDIAQSIAWRLEHEMEQKKHQPLIDKIMEKIRSILSNNAATGHNPKGEDNAMPVEQKDFDALKQTVEGLVTSAAKTNETLAASVKAAIDAAMKPVTDQLTAIQTNAKAVEDAERVTLAAKVVKAGLLTEAGVKDIAINTLRELADKAEPQTAAPLFGGFALNKDDKSAEAGSFLDNLIAAGGDK